MVKLTKKFEEDFVRNVFMKDEKLFASDLLTEYLNQQNLESMSSLPDYCSSESDVSIPTLDDVFRLFERQVLVNVEVKTPINSEIHKRYNG